MNDKTKALAQTIASQKRAQLARLAGKKEHHARRASELFHARLENRAAAVLRKTEFDLTTNHHLDLYVTPEWLAEDMVSRCDDPLFRGVLWCEPSAGTGRIVQAMLDAGHHPFCVELNYNAAQHLRKKFPSITVMNRDFLDPPTQVRSDNGRTEFPPFAGVFIMNPPFSGGQDIKHVTHAYRLLNEGGRIVSVMSESAFTQSTKRGRDFRQWLYLVGGSSEKLPGDTFRESGTGVNTRLVIIDK